MTKLVLSLRIELLDKIQHPWHQLLNIPFVPCWLLCHMSWHAAAVAANMHTLNMLRAPRRFGWLIWPWMGTVPKPRLRSVSAILRVLSQVRAKIMTVEPASSVSAYAR